MCCRSLIQSRFCLALLGALGLSLTAQANGIYDNGTGARSMAMGGADVAWASDPLGAMGVNPAGLAFIPTPELSFGGKGGFVSGHFDKPGVSSGDLDSNPAAIPEAAFAMPLGKWPVVVGLSFVPESTDLVNWHYPDPPSAGGVSYGPQQNRAEIINLRSAIGIAGQVNPQLSFGASVGLIYNKNELTTPYPFQNLEPAAAADGAKTLLNLQTEGLGWDAQVGVIYKPTPDLQFGVSYESPTTIVSTGDASGNPSAQFGASLAFSLRCERDEHAAATGPRRRIVEVPAAVARHGADRLDRLGGCLHQPAAQLQEREQPHGQRRPGPELHRFDSAQLEKRVCLSRRL